MDVLVVGVSSIVIRRVIPALARLDDVSRIHLASRRAVDSSILPPQKRGQVFESYESGLAKLAGGLAYISLPNSLHAIWACRALGAGFHVVVDKPAGTTVQEVEEMIALASHQGLCLAESTVWTFHPQFRCVRDLLSAHGEHITRATATFSFPPLPSDNFRNDPKLGGGCLLDLGPYAASCGRYFFGSPPDEVVGRFLTRDAQTGLETAFSVLATYPGGQCFVGHFGFNTEYRNSLHLLGPGVSVDFDRAFTTPPDCTPQISCRRKSRSEPIASPAGDSFELFCEHVLSGIREKNWQPMAEAMLQDAQFIEQLRTSAETSAESGA